MPGDGRLNTYMTGRTLAYSVPGGPRYVVQFLVISGISADYLATFTAPG